MEILITHNINFNMTDLTNFFRDALASQGRPCPLPPAGTAAGFALTPAGVAAVEKEVAAQNVAAAESEAPRSRAPRSPKKETPAPVAAAATVVAAPAAAPAEAVTEEEKKKQLEVLRERLQDYGADNRYGMNGVIAILGTYGVERITALPFDRYAAFKKELDEALAKPAVNPLA